MTDLGSFIAVGLTGFLAGIAYANRDHLNLQRAAILAGAIVVDSRAYLVTHLPLGDEKPAPPARPGELAVIDGGKSGDAA